MVIVQLKKSMFIPTVKGMSPSTVVTAVKSTGRSRMTPASMTASVLGRPATANRSNFGRVA